MGSTKGARPTIVLDSNSAGFTSASSPKPIFKIWRVGNAAANLFGIGIRNINIKVKSGNAGAVGISFDGHQRNSLENISIDLTEAGFAGFTDVPGMGSTNITGMEVIGGDYGLYTRQSNRAVFNDLTLTNQRIAAIDIDAFWDVTIVGFKITKNQAPAIQTKTSLGLIDGIIDFANASSTPAIDNSAQGNVTLYNVYFNKATQIIKSGNQNAVSGNASGWSHITEYYAPTTNNSLSILNGQVTTSTDQIVGQISNTAPPVDLRTYHKITRTHYSPDDIADKAKQPNSGFCNAGSSTDTYTIVPNSSTDNGTQFQKMIDECTTVFVPRGNYFLGKTITLRKNTQLIGLAHNLTLLSASSNFDDNSASTWKPTTSTDFITTVDDATATTWLSDVKINAPTTPSGNDWFVILHWKAGRNSTIVSIDPRPRSSSTADSTPNPYLKMSGNAGGKWMGVLAAGTVGSGPGTHAGKRRLLIQGTTEPMNLYNLNAEDGYGDAQIEINTAKNISVYGSKFEQDHGVRIVNSQNLAYFGGQRAVAISLNNTPSVLVAGIREGHYIRESFNGTVIDRTLTSTNLAVLKRGTVNRIQIPVNGGGITTTPDPTTEPTTLCPAKNRGDSDCKADQTGKAVTILDYAIWYSEFIGGCSETNIAGCGANADSIGTTMDSNFNFPGTNYLTTDMKVDIFDYAVWIQGYLVGNGL